MTRGERIERVASIERVDRLEGPAATEVGELLERAEAQDGDPPVGEHKLLRLRDGESDTFALIARVDDVVAGYAQTTRFPALGAAPERLAAELVVDPRRRGQGIGRGLLERLVEEARAARVARLDLWGHHAEAGCAQLARSIGMLVTRALWRLSLKLDGIPPHLRSDEHAAEVQLRPFRPGADEDAVVELVRAAFPDHPENAEWTRDDFDQRAAQEWFDPSALLLAESGTGGRLLGVHWMKLERDAPGEVYMLGVAPEKQGHGLGRTLLLAGLEEMRRRGVRVAFLYVESDNEAAMHLYRQAGFHREHLDTCYSLELDADAGHPPQSTESG